MSRVEWPVCGSDDQGDEEEVSLFPRQVWARIGWDLQIFSQEKAVPFLRGWFRFKKRGPKDVEAAENDGAV